MGHRIDVEELIDATVVAAVLGLKHRNTVASYQRRYADFPAPVVVAASGRCRLWSRADVARWAERRIKAGKVRSR
jgi:predicted DNA-binding transcriptional regulator AlpA